MNELDVLMFGFISDHFGWICISILWILTLAAYTGRRSKK